MFDEYFEENGIDAIVFASKNGIPIASHIKKRDRSESFSALSATVMGASEVIFSGLDKECPEIIEILSKDSIMLIKGIGRSSVLSLLGDSSRKDELKDTLLEIEQKINEIKRIESERGN